MIPFIWISKADQTNKLCRDLCLGDMTFWWIAGACKEGTQGSASRVLASSVIDLGANYSGVLSCIFCLVFVGVGDSIENRWHT